MRKLNETVLTFFCESLIYKVRRHSLYNSFAVRDDLFYLSFVCILAFRELKLNPGALLQIPPREREFKIGLTPVYASSWDIFMLYPFVYNLIPVKSDVLSTLPILLWIRVEATVSKRALGHHLDEKKYRDGQTTAV